MNKIFRSLWNPTLGAWVAAPETARGHARSACTRAAAYSCAHASRSRAASVAFVSVLNITHF